MLAFAAHYPSRLAALLQVAELDGHTLKMFVQDHCFLAGLPEGVAAFKLQSSVIATLELKESLIVGQALRA